jgi:hypothetical protein
VIGASQIRKRNNERKIEKGILSCSLYVTFVLIMGEEVFEVIENWNGPRISDRVSSLQSQLNK